MKEITIKDIDIQEGTTFVINDKTPSHATVDSFTSRAIKFRVGPDKKRQVATIKMAEDAIEAGKWSHFRNPGETDANEVFVAGGSIEAGEQEAYMISPVEGNDIFADKENLPRKVIELGPGVHYIRIWSQKSKMFRNIGRKRLLYQFKDHPMHDVLKNHPYFTAR